MPLVRYRQMPLSMKSAVRLASCLTCDRKLGSGLDFNTEIWQLAGEVEARGFTALRDSDRHEIASAIGNSISRHINTGNRRPWP
jgi:hypothetical protein